MAGMTLIKCIAPGGYDSSRRDVGRRWSFGESRTVSDTAASYLLTTFPAWFVVDAGGIAEVQKSLKAPPADRAMPAPSTVRSAPDLTAWLSLGDKALVRRINAGKADEVLADLSDALEGSSRANVIRAIKRRTAAVAGG